MTRCSGPCLPHCYKCSRVTAGLAYLALAYLMTSVVYLVLTINIGTPFSDNLTAEQRCIKAKAVRKRGGIFLISIVFSTVILAMTRPLRRA